MSEQSFSSLSDKLRLFADIARLRRGPEDVPANRALLLGTILTYSALSIVMGLILSDQSGPLVAPALLTLAVTLVALQLLLKLAHKPERFMQTATAMLGLKIVLMPALLVTGWLIIRYEADKSWQLPVALLRLVVEIWVLTVSARILRSATEWPLAACVVLTIALELFTLLMVMALFMPAPLVPAPT